MGYCEWCVENGVYCLNQIVGELDGEYEYACVWFCLCSYKLFTFSMLWAQYFSYYTFILFFTAIRENIILLNITRNIICHAPQLHKLITFVNNQYLRIQRPRRRSWLYTFDSIHIYGVILNTVFVRDPRKLHALLVNSCYHPWVFSLVWIIKGTHPRSPLDTHNFQVLRVNFG